MMGKKENSFLLGLMIFVLLITFKIWIKFTFDLKIIGLILLFIVSWTIKYFIFKKINKN